VVEGKTSYVFQWLDGRQVKGQEWLTGREWPWRESAQVPGRRDARLTATSPPDGRVTVVVVDPPGRDRYSRLCRETSLSAPRLIRAWRRRSWIEQSFRTLKPLLATDACQVQSEAASYGHFVLRLMAGLVLLYTARVVFKGRVTMEELVFSVKHQWRFLESEMLELQALSWDIRPRAA
jgi:hypothetical protein